MEKEGWDWGRLESGDARGFGGGGVESGIGDRGEWKRKLEKSGELGWRWRKEGWRVLFEDENIGERSIKIRRVKIRKKKE